MAGLYGALFGENPRADVLLATLGLTRADVGRFRDCFISEGKIAVYTRNGGGNRDHWERFIKTPGSGPVALEENEQEEGPDCDCPGCIITYRLPKHPHYSHDRDDEFDSTYSTIYFNFPPEYAEDLGRLDTGEKFDPSKRWQDMLASLKGP